MPTMPSTEEVRKVREQAATAVASALEQVRTPLLAAFGAGDLAAKAIVDTLSKTKDRVSEQTESTKAAINQVQDDPAELRRLLNAYTDAAAELYNYLAGRGEEALGRLRNAPQVQRALDRVEAGVEAGKERAEDVRELADDVLGKVTNRVRSAGEKTAKATEDAALDVAETAEKAGEKVSEAAVDAGEKAATGTRKASTRKTTAGGSATRRTSKPTD